MAGLRTKIKRFRSDKSPFHVFSAIQKKCDICFFLDSPSYKYPDQCYSYLGWNPFIEIKTLREKTWVKGKICRTIPNPQIFSFLRKLFKKYTFNTKRPFFSGGAVGYWGYESVAFFESVVFKKRRQAYPLIHLGLYKDLLVYDHKQREFILVVNVDLRAGILSVKHEIALFHFKRHLASIVTRLAGADLYNRALLRFLFRRIRDIDTALHLFCCFGRTNNHPVAQWLDCH